MAGNKKKKKPAANPARGFATTSIAAKPRPEATESQTAAPSSAPPDKNDVPPSTTETPKADSNTSENPLSAEEFEKQLEESELQLLVEKLAQKCKRDAARQRNRLETDRRLLRGQAESVNSFKWFSADLMDHIQDLISGETRFSVSSLSAESHGAGKMPSEEEMVSRLWTLQLTLQHAGFEESRVRSAVKHILDITPSISTPGKDLIWGLEESLDWLARECGLEELPAYDNRPKPTSKGETPSDSPIPSRSTTPKPNRHLAGRGLDGRDRKMQSPVKKTIATCDSDVEPDELIPEYISTKTKLLELSRTPAAVSDDNAMTVAKLEAKIQMIENDVLFDKPTAEAQWRGKKIAVEQQLAVTRKQREAKRENAVPMESLVLEDPKERGINNEAERVAAEILAQVEDMDDLEGLFDSLPQSEIDPATGKSQIVINSADGRKMVLKDFGKWTGMGPRRILEEACRSSAELGENCNDIGTNRSLIGYSIRLEANVSKETRLIYATIGIVMRMLEGSNDLKDITHLVLDEVHERSIDSDFLLIVLKRLMIQRKDLKVVLMSATVDADRFSAYLGGAPILNVPGRTFPVEVRYLEDAIELTSYTPPNSAGDKMVDLDDDIGDADPDAPKSEISQSLAAYSPKTRSTLSQLDEYQIEFDLIVQLIARIATDEDLQSYSSAILIFLPGIAEIRTLNDMLLGDPRFAKEWLVYPLHSTIATDDQEAAFLIPPPGMRKIVLATNIAETGITIPDVTCVIDTGKHREMRFDERRQLSRLIDTFISRANAKQRRGRAGRVQKGLCFHMYTQFRHNNLMGDQQTPEMLRLSLQDLAIRVKICKIGGIEETLGDALDPPSAKNIRRAIDALIDVRALTPGEDLTPLGHQLARLPLDVFLGKLILFGTIFKCLDVALTLAAILSSKSPFSAPFGQRAQADNARAAFRRADSDLLTVYNAYLGWKKTCLSNSGVGKEMQFCRKNFLSQQTLSNIEDLKGQLLVSLADSGFLPLTDEERKALSRQRFSGGRGRRQQHFFEVPGRVNMHSDNDVVSASVVAWSFYPKLLVRDTPGMKGMRNIGNNQSISIHPSSVNRGHFDIKWLSYYHIMQSKS
ncbi:ATP-dependent RNA helicase A [Cordyceps militaris CM01]|uniref:ATP-dependent RNA helicase A n=1 Tax=Cordyceps militaris (strain CM01) TaxID=983644 RepID=G3J606_CORMM|nr:ATP-dependent RNA helicase A [Cordyceps militaris CM01]EGX96110.1 ATP-dependent RNA helicase A [Cordyceps militaris CM01]